MWGGLTVILLIFLITPALTDRSGNHDDKGHNHGDADHHHGDEDHHHGNVADEDEEVKLFIRRIFDKYGDDGRMSFEGFEHLLANLGLGEIKITDHDIHDHYTHEGEFQDFHGDHDHSNQTEGNHHDHGNHDNHGDDHDEHGHGHGNHDDHDHSNHGDDHGHSNHDDHHEEEGNEHGNHDDHHSHNHHHDDHNHDDDHNGNHDDHDHSNHDDHKHNKDDDHDRGNHDDHAGDEGEHHHPDLNVTSSLTNSTLPSNHGNHTVREKRAIASQSKAVKCLKPDETFAAFELVPEKGLTEKDFLYVCPAILYQIDAHACSTQPPCPSFHETRDWHCQDYHDNHHHKDHHGNHDDKHDHHGNQTDVHRVSLAENFWKIPGRVWGFAVLSVTIISLVGLLSVALIPIMNKVFYNHLLHFLVALAIGTLTGDALLHLLPHSLAPSSGDHSHEEGGEGHAGHRDGIYKGLVVLAGIYIFFIMERVLAMATQLKRSRRKQKRGDPQSPYNTNERAAEIGQKLSQHNNTYASCGNFMSDLNRDLKKMADDAQEELKELKAGEDGFHDNCGHGSNHDDHEKGHGHSHGGHSHGAVPDSVSAIAWMVIMGDGLHNFTDGLAIGASFSSSLSAGVSTTVAVFCHELPHELGDFAVLLRAGMSVKQALIYNILSSVLCIIGMVIGVILGNFSSANQWIFAMTAGIFIYISLVDMLPEVTSHKAVSGPAQCGHLFLQCIGISVGVSIMLLIALFEDKIALNLGDTVV